MKKIAVILSVALMSTSCLDRENVPTHQVEVTLATGMKDTIWVTGNNIYLNEGDLTNGFTTVVSSVYKYRILKTVPAKSK